MSLPESILFVVVISLTGLFILTIVRPGTRLGPASIALCLVGATAVVALAEPRFLDQERSIMAQGVRADAPGEVRTVPPREGLACPSLLEAQGHFLAGNTPDFEHAVSEAARIAMRTLNASDEAFGVPERKALQLNQAIARVRTEPAVVESLLNRARSSCSQDFGNSRGS